jgi:hypothetical protein
MKFFSIFILPEADEEHIWRGHVTAGGAFKLHNKGWVSHNVSGRNHSGHLRHNRSKFLLVSIGLLELLMKPLRVEDRPQPALAVGYVWDQ